jgi:hypothetical protein
MTGALPKCNKMIVFYNRLGNIPLYDRTGISITGYPQQESMGYRPGLAMVLREGIPS